MNSEEFRYTWYGLFSCVQAASTHPEARRLAVLKLLSRPAKQCSLLQEGHVPEVVHQAPDLGGEFHILAENDASETMVFANFNPDMLFEEYRDVVPLNE